MWSVFDGACRYSRRNVVWEDRDLVVAFSETVISVTLIRCVVASLTLRDFVFSRVRYLDKMRVFQTAETRDVSCSALSNRSIVILIAEQR